MDYFQGSREHRPPWEGLSLSSELFIRFIRCGYKIIFYKHYSHRSDCRSSLIVVHTDSLQTDKFECLKIYAADDLI